MLQEPVVAGAEEENMNDLPEFNIMLFVLGAMRWLQDNGYARGESPLLPRGTGEFDQLEASGFRPKLRDIVDAIQALRGTAKMRLDDESAAACATLIAHWDELKAHHRQQQTSLPS